MRRREGIGQGMRGVLLLFLLSLFSLLSLLLFFLFFLPPALAQGPTATELALAELGATAPNAALPITSGEMIALTQADYVLGDSVPILILEVPERLRVTTPSTTFSYLGAPQNPLVFVPKEQGTYVVRAIDGQGAVVDELSFVVRAPEQIPADAGSDIATPKSPFLNASPNTPPNTPPNTSPNTPPNTSPDSSLGAGETEVAVSQNLLHGPRGRPVPATVTLLADDGRVLLSKSNFVLEKSGLLEAVRASVPRATILVEPTDGSFARLELNDAVTSNFTIGIDRPGGSKILQNGAFKEQFIDEGLRVVATYAVDPSGVAFTEGRLTRTAQGDALYKCADWRFEEQSCAGSWKKIMDLVPGNDYSVAIDAADPAFVETGVATVNTRKPIYTPGESAELVIVALDTRGYLVGDATVTLEVTGPEVDGVPGTTTILSTTDGSIQESERGIYAATLPGTATVDEGTYDLFVSIVGSGVDTVMASTFDVRSSYAFDIVRDSPPTIDPWNGPYKTRLRVDEKDAVLSPSANGDISVVEEIPAGFVVTDSGGASVRTAGDRTFLTWKAPPSTTLSYWAQAPLVSPDLQALGPTLVTWEDGRDAVGDPPRTFLEARVWWLAIDPSDTLDPIVHTNTENAGAALSADEVEYIKTDNETYVTVAKGKVLTAELSDPQNVTPIESVTSLSCSVIYTSQAYSPDADFIVYDAFGGNALDSTTLPASTSVDDMATLSDLQNAAAFDIADLWTLVIYIKNNDAGSPQNFYADDLWCVVDYIETDISPPEVYLWTPATGDYYSSATIEFNYTASDNRDFDNCTLLIDGTLNASNATQIQNATYNTITTDIGEGVFTWDLNCTDGSGNSARNGTPLTFTIDLTAPSPFNLASPENDTVSTDLTPTFTWNPSTEANFKNYTLLLDDAPTFASPNYIRKTLHTVDNTSFTFTTVVSSNTKYYWKVIAYDVLHHSQESSETWMYITDTVAPSAFNLVAPPSETITNNLTPLFDWQDTVETNFDNYTVLVDNNSDFSSPERTFFALRETTNSSYQVGAGEALDPDMLWYWKVIAYDRAGYSRESSTTRNYTTDNTAPNVTLSAPEPDHTETISNTMYFNYTVNDTLSDVASCQLIINDTIEATQSDVPEGPLQTFEHYLENGYYEWWINCTDNPGNKEESVHRFLTVDVTVDSTPPLVTPYFPTIDDFVNTTTLNFNYSVQDATGIENCSLYINGTFNATDDSVENGVYNYFLVSTFVDGYYSWYVACYDNSTSYNYATSAPRNFTIDSSPPTAFTLLNPENATFTNQRVQQLNWTVTTDDHFDNYTVVLDNDSDFSSPEYTFFTNNIAETNYTTPALDDALYYWKVIAYDTAGSKRDSTEIWQFLILTTLPNIRNIAEDPLDPVEYNPSRSYHFNITVDEEYLDTVLFENDFGASLQNATPSGNVGGNYYYTLSGLTVDTFQYRWHVNDSAGNRNQTDTFAYTVTKNTTTSTLYFNGTSADIVINESSIINITAVLNWPSYGQSRIHKNGSLLAQNASWVSVYYNFSTPGTYLLNASYVGDALYKSSIDSHTVTVNDIYDPNVTLVLPPHTSEDIDGQVNFQYRVEDSNKIANCSLYLDGVWNDTSPTVVTGATSSFVKFFPRSRNLTWSVNCTDISGRTGNSTTWNLSINIRRYTLPLIPLVCADADGCSVANVNVSDATYEQHGSLSKNPGNNYVYMNMTNTSIPPGATIKNVTVAWEKYQAANHLEGTFYFYWLNGSTWQLACSKTFNVSSEAAPDNLYCQLPVDIYPNRTVFNDGIQLRGDFFYSGSPASYSFGTDFVGMNVTYEEDMTPPVVTLNGPEDEVELGAGDVTFNITATDPNLQNCTLYGDFNGTFLPNVTMTTDDGIESGISFYFDPVYLGPGYYTWNAYCIDSGGFAAFAEYNFTINITPPDLTTTRFNITFNPTSPRELENTTLFATIYNLGRTTAKNFFVQFYKGDPDGGGVKIDGNLSIASLAYLQNVTVNVTFRPTIGPNKVFVLLDIDDSIEELLETNNKANRTLNVAGYHDLYGNATANITLDAQDNETIYAFLDRTNVTGNLYFVRDGDYILWNSLRELGVTTNELNTTDDFSDADTLLNMTEFNDSINYRWTGGDNRPDDTYTMVAHQRLLRNVPVIRSGPANNFITGILWDSSDDTSSNTEYDTTDKENLVFLTKVTAGEPGDYGQYDYEIYVPARLQYYAGQEYKNIDLYFELQ